MTRPAMARQRAMMSQNTHGERMRPAKGATLAGQGHGGNEQKLPDRLGAHGWMLGRGGVTDRAAADRPDRLVLVVDHRSGLPRPPFTVGRDVITASG